MEGWSRGRVVKGANYNENKILLLPTPHWHSLPVKLTQIGMHDLRTSKALERSEPICTQQREIMPLQKQLLVKVNVYELSAGTLFKASKLMTGLGLHSVLPLTISAPSSSRSKCLHSMNPPPPAKLPTSAPETSVRDCSTLFLPHSLLYSNVMAYSS